MTTAETAARLDAIRDAINAENVSYEELADLQTIAEQHPDLFADNALLAEWAGIPEDVWAGRAP